MINANWQSFVPYFTDCLNPSPLPLLIPFPLPRENLKYIVAENEAQEGYTLDANFMAALTPEEQKQYYGINITALPVEEDLAAPPTECCPPT